MNFHLRVLGSQVTALRANYSLKSILSLLQLLMESALVVFFIAYGMLHWNNISAIFIQLSPLWLLLCMLVYSAMHFFAVLATASLLRSFGHPRSSLPSIHAGWLPSIFPEASGTLWAEVLTWRRAAFSFAVLVSWWVWGNFSAPATGLAADSCAPMCLLFACPLIVLHFRTSIARTTFD